MLFRRSFRTCRHLVKSWNFLQHTICIEMGVIYIYTYTLTETTSSPMKMFIEILVFIPSKWWSLFPFSSYVSWTWRVFTISTVALVSCPVITAASSTLKAMARRCCWRWCGWWCWRCPTTTASGAETCRSGGFRQLPWNFPIALDAGCIHPSENIAMEPPEKMDVFFFWNLRDSRVPSFSGSGGDAWILGGSSQLTSPGTGDLRSPWWKNHLQVLGWSSKYWLVSGLLPKKME